MKLVSQCLVGREWLVHQILADHNCYIPETTTNLSTPFSCSGVVVTLKIFLGLGLIVTEIKSTEGWHARNVCKQGPTYLCNSDNPMNCLKQPKIYYSVLLVLAYQNIKCQAVTRSAIGMPEDEHSLYTCQH